MRGRGRTDCFTREEQGKHVQRESLAGLLGVGTERHASDLQVYIYIYRCVSVGKHGGVASSSSGNGHKGSPFP